MSKTNLTEEDERFISLVAGKIEMRFAGNVEKTRLRQSLIFIGVKTTENFIKIILSNIDQDKFNDQEPTPMEMEELALKLQWVIKPKANLGSYQEKMIGEVLMKFMRVYFKVVNHELEMTKTDTANTIRRLKMLLKGLAYNEGVSYDEMAKDIPIEAIESEFLGNGDAEVQESHYWKERNKNQLNKLSELLIENKRLEKNQDLSELFSSFKIPKEKKIKWLSRNTELMYLFLLLFKGREYLGETIYGMASKMFIDKFGKEIDKKKLNVALLEVEKYKTTPSAFPSHLTLIETLIQESGII